MEQPIAFTAHLYPAEWGAVLVAVVIAILWWVILENLYEKIEEEMVHWCYYHQGWDRWEWGDPNCGRLPKRYPMPKSWDDYR